MSLALTTRVRRTAVIAAATMVAAAGLVATYQLSASAATNYGVTLTKAAVGLTGTMPARVAGLTASQQITLTGTNFDEALIASIVLGSDTTNCAAVTSYIVTSSTTILVKTPSTGCAVSTAGAEDITITEVPVGGSTGTVTLAAAVIFVAPPAIATTRPVLTENSAGLTSNEVTVLTAPGALTTGLQRVRIRAAATFAFDIRTSSGLKVTLAGKDLSGLAVFNSDGTPQTTSVGPAPSTDAANWVVGTLGLGLTAPATSTLAITQNSVTKTFTPTQAGFTFYSGPVVTGLDITSGKAFGGTTVKINGAGFDAATLGNNTVKFCGVTAATPTASTGSGAAGGTSLTVVTPVVVNLLSGLGVGNYAGFCPVTVTVGSAVSPVVATSYYGYLTN
jgi:hypothetical protein